MSRTPRTPRIAIIGAGFGGIGMAVKLQKAGFAEFTIFERGDGVGGTWRANTYPGAACDVPSHLYSFSFEQNPYWSRRFSPQAEILAYLERTAHKYDVIRHIEFGTEVERGEYDESTNTWLITLTDGVTHTFDLVITACGQLNRPAYPRIPGLGEFTGKVMHSAQWDHDYDLTDKAVGVIGTGASAIQFVPEVATVVDSLTLFQRSAAWTIRKPDYPYSVRAQRLFAAVPATLRASRLATYWRYELNALAFTKYSWIFKPYEWRFKKRVVDTVRDRRKAKQLIPDYKMGCKRLLLTNDWHPTLDQDHVSIVTDNIERVTPDGVVTADGAEHPIDALLLGTGFQASDFLTPMEFVGRDGLKLNERWRDGAEAYYGMSVPQFPNLFVLYGPNTNLSHSSIVFMLEAQIGHVVQAAQVLAEGAGFIEVRDDVHTAYNTRIQADLADTVWASGCDSWYLKNGKNTNQWPGFTYAFRQAVRTLRREDYVVGPDAGELSTR